MLARLDISLGLSAGGQLQHGISLILPLMTLQRPPILRRDESLPEVTANAHLRRSLIFIGLTPLIIHPSLEQVPSRAAEGISHRVIAKGLFRKDTVLPA